MGTFFINRPIFAWVIAIVTMIAGTWALKTLPVSQYPDIAPTVINISASYPGATAEAVQNSVTRVLEDSLTGLEDQLYMESRSSKSSANITITFDEKVDPIDAQNEVQSRITRVESRLPTIVTQLGVNVRRSTTGFLMVGAITDSSGHFTSAQLGNVVEETLEEPLSRTLGVGNIRVFGAGYAMRIWLDPVTLARYQLTPNDVVSAVRAQNVNVSVGSLGNQPTVPGQQFTAAITSQSQLRTAEEFEHILLKSSQKGGKVYLGDVAKVEIGQSSYGRSNRFTGKTATGFGISLASGANAVATSQRVRSELERLSHALPPGVTTQIAFDTSPFVERSISQVYHTLIEAVIMVVLVLLVFLQSFRATFIPLIAVPVVLLGTFVVLALTRFSINTLTMFAMVLAIGLLVDDAIVVVENTERIMEQEKLGAKAATYRSMTQITSALIGIAVVLMAVFLPMAFFPGSTGVIYRQFSITMVTAMSLSLIVAVTLSPALCGSMLKPKQGEINFAPARWFNRGFAAFSHSYSRAVRFLVNHAFLAILFMVVVVLAAWGVYSRLHTSFLPTEDQGVLMAVIRLQEGSTSQQTLSVVKNVENYLNTNEKENVKGYFSVVGFSFGGSGQQQAMMFMHMAPFEKRKAKARSAAAIALRANRHFFNNRQAQIFFMQPPAIRGIGQTGGFSMFLTDERGGGISDLIDAGKQLEEMARNDTKLQNVDAGGIEKESALKLVIDQSKAESLGLNLSNINSMLSVIFAGRQVNYFLLGSYLRPVIVQADAPFRMQPEDVDKWYARNSRGEMVPFSAFTRMKWEPVPPSLQRFNGVAALGVSGSPGPRYSSGEAMKEMQKLVKELPGGYGTAWTGVSYQEIQAGNQAPILYALSALVVFLALAALYESWTIPFAVMLSVPIGIFGTLLATWVFGQTNDVYFKVGMLTTIGLAARNAILIVEFAEQLREDGMEVIDAAVKAANLRLRPIMMTALTFILGVMPLAAATGAGAAAQNSIGIGVVGGMIFSTFVGIFLVPALYVAVRSVFQGGSRKQEVGA